MMRLGVVILNYKSYDVTLDCLAKMEKLNLVDDIIVVDNNSPNDSYQKLQAAQLGHRWKLLQSGENRGYSAGNNIGIRYLMEHTDDDIIGIVNPDVSFDDGFCANLAIHLPHTMSTLFLPAFSIGRMAASAIGLFGQH